MQGTRTAGPGWLDAFMERLDRWSERVSYELFRFGIYVATPALVVLVTLDVTLRYVFNAPLQWGRDVNGLLLLIAISCTLPHAWDRSYHIRMEVFYSRFTPVTKRRADVLASLAGVIYFAMVAVQGARFVPFMIQTGETGEDLEFVLWPFMVVLSICALVVVARVFSNPAADDTALRYPSVSMGAGPSEADEIGATALTGGLAAGDALLDRGVHDEAVPDADAKDRR